MIPNPDRQRLLGTIYVLSYFVQLTFLLVVIAGCVVLALRSTKKPEFDGLSTSLMIIGVIGTLLSGLVRMGMDWRRRRE